MTALLMLGYGLVGIGGIWLVFKAGEESIVWGLGALLVPFVGVIFALRHWDDCKTPFFLSLGGGVSVLVAKAVMGAGT